MRPASAVDPATALDTLQRRAVQLARDYEVSPLADTLRVAGAVERTAETAAMDAGRTRLRTNLRAVRAQLLTLCANAALDIGNVAEGQRRAEEAYSLARRLGDPETTAHAASVRSAAFLAHGSPEHAFLAARTGVILGGNSPAACMATVARAMASAHLGHQDDVRDAVRDAETRHVALPPTVWGRPGYSLRTYHPGNLQLSAAGALIRAGLHAEAQPRCEEAEHLTGGHGLNGTRSYLAILYSRIAVGAERHDEAIEQARIAVAVSLARPAAWLAAAIQDLNRATDGRLVDLVEQTAGWIPTAADRHGSPR